MAADPRAALARVLAALGHDPALAQAVPIPTARLADEESRAWVERFRREAAPSTLRRSTVDRLHQAIDNNVGHYRAILGRLGVPFHVAPGLAHTPHWAPPFHSNAVTRSAGWRPDAAFDAVAAAAEAEGWPDWSVKDSHDALDLAPKGFRRLFRATWVHLDPAHLPRPATALRVERVEDEAGLALWRRAWDPEPEITPGPARTLFGPGLLGNPDLHFVLARRDGRVAGGCLLNRTGDVLGVSNFFAAEDPAGCWGGALAFVLDRERPSAVVGYARDAVLPTFQALGFEPLGPLSVWHRPAAPG